MFVFGHAGLTAWAARKADPDVDWRWAAALALGPDLLDKPLSVLAPSLAHGNTRGLGHTLLLSSALFAGLLVWKRRPKTAALLWACWSGHFLLDLMWLAPNRAIVLWPLFGDFPPPTRGPFWSPLTVYNLVGEAVGLWCLAQVHLPSPDRRA